MTTMNETPTSSDGEKAGRALCEALAEWKTAWNSDPVSGVNSVQSGPTLRIG